MKKSFITRLLWSKNSYISVLLLALILPLMLLMVSERQTLTQHAAETHQVNIVNYAMDPRSMTVRVGDTVQWTNQDEDAHDAHSNTEVFASPLLQKGESYSFTFTEPGTFEYYCTPHRGQMNGYTIIVLPEDTPTVEPTTEEPTEVPSEVPSEVPTEVPAPTDISPTFACLGCAPTDPASSGSPSSTPDPYVTINQPTQPPVTAGPTQAPQPGSGGQQNGALALILILLKFFLSFLALLF